MTIALELAKDNRFVLRSASRLWISLDDPERAHDVLLRTDRTRYDPWLLSAEMAIGNIVNKRSRFLNDARRMFTLGQISPSHLSELASAIAMLELGYGRNRRARRWFEKSLEQPTENSVAQFAWASRNRGIVLDLEDAYPPNTFEADAWNNFQARQWEDSVEQCKFWYFDQPFSSRPCILGSYVSSIALDDNSTSEWFAARGLVADPSNFMLLNNLAFARIHLGDMKGAREVLSKINRSQLSDHERLVFQATQGLFAFRNGDVEEGRKLYSQARSQAKSRKSDAMHSVVYELATIFHALEEASQGECSSEVVVSEAFQILEGSPNPIFGVLFRKLERFSTETNSHANL